MVDRYTETKKLYNSATDRYKSALATFEELVRKANSLQAAFETACVAFDAAQHAPEAAKSAAPLLPSHRGRPSARAGTSTVTVSDFAGKTSSGPQFSSTVPGCPRSVCGSLMSCASVGQAGCGGGPEHKATQSKAESYLIPGSPQRDQFEGDLSQVDQAQEEEAEMTEAEAVREIALLQPGFRGTVAGRVYTLRRLLYQESKHNCVVWAVSKADSPVRFLAPGHSTFVVPSIESAVLRRKYGACLCGRK